MPDDPCRRGYKRIILSKEHAGYLHFELSGHSAGLRRLNVRLVESIDLHHCPRSSIPSPRLRHYPEIVSAAVASDSTLNVKRQEALAARTSAHQWWYSARIPGVLGFQVSTLCL
jgi:hypothetical protein